MSIPYVVNRAPAPDSIGGITESIRFGVRDGTTEINRSALQCFLGWGPAFYRGDVLPEDHESVAFYLEAWQGAPNAPSVRSIAIDGSLKLEKVMTPLPQGQESVYFFGGLQAPANPDDPLMIEFTVKLSEGDVVVDPNDFTGVAFGLMAGKKGLAVKFFSDGVNRRVEVHVAAHATTTPPSGSYVSAFDWTGAFYTYKLLWHPGRNIVRLYRSSGSGDLTDVLMVNGQVTDFPDLPVLEQRENAPWAFFGHLESSATSTSYWKTGQLHNSTSAPVHDGILAGGHQGFIRTNNQILYSAKNLPRKDDTAWNILPGSFGTIEGTEGIDGDGLVIRRSNPLASFGYYRHEPKIGVAGTVYDFKAGGVAYSQDLGIETTGMEFYVDDGTRCCRVAFLQTADSTQYVGILVTSASPELLTSYERITTSFNNVEQYRLVFRPGGMVSLYQVIDYDQGKDLFLMVSLPYGSLPASMMPGPGLGFLHNAIAGNSTAALRIQQIRYRLGEDFASPVDMAGWTQTGGGSVDTSGAEIILSDASSLAADNILLSRTYATLLQPDNGFVAEFRMKIDSYETLDAQSPVRTFTGVVLRAIDFTYQVTLVFAEAGPPYGKIVFFLTNPDIDQNLLDIRAGAGETAETFYSLDWTTFHVYRFEKTVGGKLALFVDEETAASLTFDEPAFPYPVTPGGSPRLEFGHVGDGVKTVSKWSFLNFCRSDGFEVSVLPNRTEEELFSHFDHAVNVIVEAEDV